MNYSADKLAAIFGCTVTGIMDINREILFEQVRSQCPFNVYDIAYYFVRGRPTEDFGPWVKLNQNTWVSACKELWKRHKKAEKIYNDAYKECFEAHEKLEEMLDTLDNPFHSIKYEDAFAAASEKNYTTFKELVKIEEALLRSRIVTQELD
jgi:hypothetical protein